jgi:hypothetical protein
MDHQNNPIAVSVARARALLAAATIGVERLERAAHQASCGLAALTGMLAQLEGRGGHVSPTRSRQRRWAPPWAKKPDTSKRILLPQVRPQAP